MPDPIETRDLKRLFGGVAVAAASGLLLGAAMQPNLGDRAVAGPQILTARAGDRSEYVVAADSGVAAYRDRMPDYVYGTDWTMPPVVEVPKEAPAAGTYAGEAATEIEPPPPVKHATWRDPPREPTVYPSMTGDTAYESEVSAPPQPPDEAAEY